MIDPLNLKPVGNIEKVAVPTRGKEVDNHFGNCEFYTVFTISISTEIVHSEIVESPVGCGCKSNIATTLKEMNVNLMLAGNIGQGAIAKLASAGIQVVRGCSGDVEKVMNDYLAGEITDSGETCAHHDNEHACSHE